VTDRERFEVILDELGLLLNRIGWLCDVVLIGGQVLAVEQVADGEDPLLQVETDTGQRIDRGYSLDPDLLIEHPDAEESNRWDELPFLLREAGYRRARRDHQWEKQVGEVYVRIDLFSPQHGPDTATPMTPLPRGDRVVARAKEVRLQVGARVVTVKTPSVLDFVLMKLDATRIRRPPHPKDSFDLYAYTRRLGAKAVGAAIQAGSPPERAEAEARLLELFGTEKAEGVASVLSFAPTLESEDRALVARDVVRLFRDVSLAVGDRTSS
jgi:hypothetical protein